MCASRAADHVQIDYNQGCTVYVSHAAAERRWTVFSSIWYLWMELKYFGTPPALRYLVYLAWRAAMHRVYEAHKTLVLWRKCLSYQAVIADNVYQSCLTSNLL